MNRKFYLTGQKFGKLTVIREDGRTPDKERLWLCQCDCGKTTSVRSYALRNGRTKSCGCQIKKATVKRSTTHGATGTRTYQIWCAIKTRTKDKSNRRYGGRGIELCQRWLDFENFLNDMGEAPKGMSIDRIDNEMGYQPGNCRWATQKQQSNNTSRNINIEFQGETRTLKEWAEHHGLSYTTVYMRYRKGDRGTRIFRSVKNAF